MTTLETLLKQVEELDAKATKGPWVTSIQHGQANIGNPYLGKTIMIPTSAGEAIQDCLLASKYREAAPILVALVRKLVEQRDGYAEALNLPTTNSGRKDNTDLDAIVAKRLRGEDS